MRETGVQSIGQEDSLERARQPTLVFLPGESMDRGAWWATVHGVARSWTWLKELIRQQAKAFFKIHTKVTLLDSEFRIYRRRRGTSVTCKAVHFICDCVYEFVYLVGKYYFPMSTFRGCLAWTHQEPMCDWFLSSCTQRQPKKSPEWKKTLILDHSS